MEVDALICVDLVERVETIRKLLRFKCSVKIIALRSEYQRVKDSKH